MMVDIYYPSHVIDHGHYLKSMKQVCSNIFYLNLIISIDLDFQARLFKKISSNNPYHKRIIWTCSFSPDDKYFLTGARDQQVHIWRVDEKSNDEQEHPCEKNVLKLNDSVTAATFAPQLIDEQKFVKSFCFL